MGQDAYVKEVDGQLVLVDPVAAGVVQAVAEHNCGDTLAMNSDRVAHFIERARVLGKSADEVVITVINVDTPIGGLLADALMPGFDWQAIRDRGEVPFARGLAGREGIQGALDELYPSAGEALRDADGFAVVVVDHGVAAVFKAEQVR